MKSERWKIKVPEIRIIMRCQDDENHAKVLRLDAKLGMEYAQTLAGLLDGSSPLYIFPPQDLSPIGKCAICGGKLKYTIEERNPDAQP
jgi:hypothetical protein